MTSSERYGHLGIRLAVSLIFINSLIGKFAGFGMTTQFMAANGFFVPTLFLILAIIIEFTGTLSLITGYMLRYGTLLLLIFVFSTTFIFHTKLVDPLQLGMFLKNIAVMGALGILTIQGSRRGGDEPYSALEKRGFVLSRIAISLIFIIMGLVKIFEFEATREMMIEAGLTSTDFFLILSIMTELAGGIAVIAGFQVRYAALGLIVYLIPITLIMHLSLTDVVQRIMFFKNVALMGALGLLALYGGRLRPRENPEL